jgi:hypothetical protein
MKRKSKFMMKLRELIEETLVIAFYHFILSKVLNTKIYITMLCVVVCSCGT